MTLETHVNTIDTGRDLLDRRLWKGVTPAILILIAIMLLSTVLHFVNLASIGDSNAYYTAAVKSMLQSWHNFFFVAAEPGGSVSVDKPPLGLWIEAGFAALLGVTGFAVSLPNILAGIFSIPILYHLVRKYLDSLAGLVAALVFAITPVVLATDRNNTMDGMLVFTLLLGAWAFIKATETGRLSWLLLGAGIVGLGFNIKMLQAFLPLPAFYSLYLFGAKIRPWRKILSLALATLLLAVVSLSWAVVVDLTPADQRPYVGSSSNNSEFDLIFGYNGVNRLLGNQPGGQPSPSLDQDGQPPQSFTDNIPGLQVPPGGMQSQPAQPPTLRESLDGQLQPGGINSGVEDRPNWGGMFTEEVGIASVMRFFNVPLAVQMSWLLPFALFSLVLFTMVVRLRIPLLYENKALVLWGGWLAACLIFFSVAEFFHGYYLIMLAPPLGAVVGGGVKILWEKRHSIWSGWVLLAAAGVTIAFQTWLALQYLQSAWWLILAGSLAVLGFFGLISMKWIKPKFIHPVTYLFLLAAMLVAPLAWSVLTVTEESPNVNLPTAYRGAEDRVGSPRNAMPGQSNGSQPGMNVFDLALLQFLEINTTDTKYLVAVPSANDGASLVLATGRPVLYMGGFSGNDPVVDAAGLEELVNNHELRYVLLNSNRGSTSKFTAWLESSCVVVSGLSSSPISLPPGLRYPVPSGSGGGSILYRCDGSTSNPISP